MKTKTKNIVIGIVIGLTLGITLTTLLFYSGFRPVGGNFAKLNNVTNMTRPFMRGLI